MLIENLMICRALCGVILFFYIPRPDAGCVSGEFILYSIFIPICERSIIGLFGYRCDNFDRVYVYG